MKELIICAKCQHLQKVHVGRLLHFVCNGFRLPKIIKDISLFHDCEKFKMSENGGCLNGHDR